MFEKAGYMSSFNAKQYATEQTEISSLKQKVPMFWEGREAPLG
jgi:hypothetical protein